MYHIAAYFEVWPDRQRDFIEAALRDGRDSMANELGTRRFELIRDARHPNRFVLNEVYDDKGAFQEHQAGRYFKEFFDTIDGFTSAPTQLFEGLRVDSLE